MRVKLYSGTMTGDWVILCRMFKTALHTTVPLKLTASPFIFFWVRRWLVQLILVEKQCPIGGDVQIAIWSLRCQLLLVNFMYISFGLLASRGWLLFQALLLRLHREKVTQLQPTTPPWRGTLHTLIFNFWFPLFNILPLEYLSFQIAWLFAYFSGLP